MAQLTNEDLEELAVEAKNDTLENLCEALTMVNAVKRILWQELERRSDNKTD